MPAGLRLATDGTLPVEDGLNFRAMSRHSEEADDVASSLLTRALEHVAWVVAVPPVAFALVVGVVDDLGEGERDERYEEGNAAGEDLEEESGLLGRGLGCLLDVRTRLEGSDED